MENPVSQKPDFGAVAHKWVKWEDWLDPCYQILNDGLLQGAGISEGKAVLDLGCGTGQPALLEAKLVGASGSVIGVDISNEMLEVARKRVAVENLKNVDFRQCDIDELPFPDAVFDAVTSRFCLMFVTSIDKTLRETFRVLKPGARFCASVWADPEKNPLPRKILEMHYALPAPDPAVPGPFRFSQQGLLKRLMKEAGFVDLTETELEVREQFIDGHHYLEHILEASALWGALLRKLDQERFTQATSAVVSAAEQFRSGDRVRIPRTAWIVSGRK